MNIWTWNKSQKASIEAIVMSHLRSACAFEHNESVRGEGRSWSSGGGHLQQPDVA